MASVERSQAGSKIKNPKVALLDSSLATLMAI